MFPKHMGQSEVREVMVLIQEVNTLVSVSEKIAGPLHELDDHDLTVGKGEERTLELLVPNQAIVLLVLSLRSQGAHVLVDQTNKAGTINEFESRS